LLKNVATGRNDNNNNNNNNNNNQNQNQNQTNGKPPKAATGGTTKMKKLTAAKLVEQEEREKREFDREMRRRYRNGEKPIWNYKNLEERKYKSNSMKDPFYAERTKIIEDRRQRQREAFSRQNNGTSNNNGDNSNNNRQNGQRATSPTMSVMSMSTRSEFTNNNNQKKNSSGGGGGGESILNLLTKNLAKNTIYEEDEDRSMMDLPPPAQDNHNRTHHNRNQQQQQQLLLSNRSDNNNNNNPNFNFELNPNDFGFVPFLRTNEFLNPAHAGSPVPPSRENSAQKRERERARQVSFSVL
jgi:hypothetical protein